MDAATKIDLLLSGGDELLTKKSKKTSLPAVVLGKRNLHPSLDCKGVLKRRITQESQISAKVVQNRVDLEESDVEIISQKAYDSSVVQMNPNEQPAFEFAFHDSKQSLVGESDSLIVVRDKFYEGNSSSEDESQTI